MGEHPNFERARGLLYTATRLMALAHDLEGDARKDLAGTITKLEPSDTVLVELARQIYSARRKRSVLPEWEELFGEPAWDMLLDLFIAAHENRDVSISSACLSAGVPSTTALRWLHILEEKGIVLRHEDPHDHRRNFVRISTAGFAEFSRYLRHIADGHSAFILLKPSHQTGEPVTA